MAAGIIMDGTIAVGTEAGIADGAGAGALAGDGMADGDGIIAIIVTADGITVAAVGSSVVEAAAPLRPPTQTC
jgi:hypothetical protein